MPQRTIQSPGVQINEVDLSQIAVTPTGTNVLVTGFASQGPTYEIVELASLSDFQTVFGTPTNAAERYFYYSVQQLFNAGGNPTIKAARLPYGDNAGAGTASNYSALAFPVVAIPSNPSVYTTSQALANNIPLSSAQGYYFGEPALVTLTPQQYTTISQGGINWSATTGNTGLSSFTLSGANVLSNLGAAGLVVINESQTTINEQFQGYYLNLADSLTNNPATNFDDAISIKSINSSYFQPNITGADSEYTVVPTNSIGFTTTAPYTATYGSLSQDIERIPTFNIAASGYSDCVILSLFKLRPSPFSPNTTTLQYVLTEGYASSLYANRTIQDVNGGVPKSLYMPTVVNPSPNLQVFVNPNISTVTNWLDANGNSTKRVRVYKANTLSTIAAALTSDPDYTFYTVASSYLNVANPTFTTANNLYAFGTYADSIPLNSSKTIGSVPAKLQYVLNAAANTDIVNVDLTVDAGLSTIWASVNTTGQTEFDDTFVNTTLLAQTQALSASNGNPVSNTLINSWNAITTQFTQFASQVRKDHVFISDPLRYIFVTGQNYKTLNNINLNFSQNIYWPLNNCYSQFNTNYSAAYANWVQIQDVFTGQNVWQPFSGYAAAMITSSDANNYFWTAPAGLNRGIITGISDIGINPLQKQRDLLYNVSLNPLVYFPGEGYVVMGQKTLQTTPTAFDRINVRRLFLYLEKAVNQTVKFFVFEPNTTFTRSRIVNTITPIFEKAKTTQGLYDYLIVCNATNNTPTVIDDNTLVVDIYIKPVRTAEFILVNFYATKTSQNFNELVG
jgi:phage tail sheath protein FI